MPENDETYVSDILDDEDRHFADNLLDKLMLVAEEVSGRPIYPYQIPFIRRILESLVTNDGDTLTALFSRQSGKTESVAIAVVTAMIMLPRLAKVYPDWLGKYTRGVAVGAFAPVDEQADNLFGRIVGMFKSDQVQTILSDTQIDDRFIDRGRVAWLRDCKSEVRKTTCHPRASIEGRTYHVILVDECQGADAVAINKSVSPMGSATNATMVFTGTPTYNKGVFYEQIRQNKRDATKRGAKQNHFEVDWRTAAKYNPDYRRSTTKAMHRMGEDSDEFK